MNMSITIHTENPNDVARVLAALAGTGVATLSPAVAGNFPPPPKAPKAEKKEASAPEPIVTTTAVTPIQSATAKVEGLTVDDQHYGKGANLPAAAEEAVPDEAALTAAANSAIAKLGAGAQAKIKAYIADNFQKDDGSPAGLRTVRADQRAILLADLKAFATGAKVI